MLEHSRNYLDGLYSLTAMVVMTMIMLQLILQLAAYLYRRVVSVWRAELLKLNEPGDGPADPPTGVVLGKGAERGEVQTRA